MPDHVHLVLEGKSERSKLWKAVNLFKQRTGFWFGKHSVDVKWQKNYYDHILRKDEDLKKHIIYVLNNPVRKGLVSHWRDYPFKGSLDFNMEEIIL
jgi:putative transposase